MFHVKPTMETVTVCPACGGSTFTTLFSCTDHLVSQNPFQLVECSTCNLRITSPRPDRSSIGSYYQSEEYVSHSGTNKGLINRLYHVVRQHAIKQKFKLINSLSKGNTVLDIGAGTGDLLAHLKGQGMEVSGVEPDSNARKVAKERNDLDLQRLDFLEEPGHSFDVISMWHVLEHIDQPQDLLSKLHGMLKGGGALVVAVPNHKSKDASIYGSDWAAYDVPRHLFHFSKGDITRLATNAGFSVETIMPMYFDAYYVSMLSEKNSGGNLIRAVFNGWRSNVNAQMRSGEFSSLIYVLRPIT